MFSTKMSTSSRKLALLLCLMLVVVLIAGNMASASTSALTAAENSIPIDLSQSRNENVQNADTPTLEGYTMSVRPAFNVTSKSASFMMNCVTNNTQAVEMWYEYWPKGSEGSLKETSKSYLDSNRDWSITKVTDLNPNTGYQFRGVYRIYGASTLYYTNIQDFSTTSATHTVSGYICPDFTFANTSAALIKSGFKVVLNYNSTTCYTNENGYFEMTGIPENEGLGYSIRISKDGYLERNVAIGNLTGNLELGSSNTPIEVWAGDMAINSQQDKAINMEDIIDILASFNTSKESPKYSEYRDINKDNAISMQDILITIQHFNSTPADYRVLSYFVSNRIKIDNPRPQSTSLWGSKVNFDVSVLSHTPIKKVEFYKGTEKIGEDTEFPYSCVYTAGYGNTSSVLGQSFLTAMAYDENGLTAISDTIDVYAYIPPPTAAPTASPTPTIAVGVSVSPSCEKTADQMILKMRINNNTYKDVTINYSTSKTYDFVLLDQNRKVIYRWSQGKAFFQVLTKDTIPAGEFLEFSVKIEGDKAKELINSACYMIGYITGTSAEFDTHMLQGYEIQINSTTPTPSPTPTPTIAVGVSVSPSCEKTADQMVLKLRIHNNSYRDATINYSSGQRFDFVLMDQNRKVIYRWSEGKAFTQALTKDTIPAGEFLEFSVKIEGDKAKELINSACYMIGYITGTSAEFDTHMLQGYEIQI
ncbi:MAG: BsuPI-related putative proteinase inhibitor [Clostridia bacterium]|nr:BsuPI-related putative proteinase inhibitor [Clostridia bacterium]